MKRLRIVILILVIMMTGCQPATEAPSSANTLENVEKNETVNVEKNKLAIVATLFPQYDFARQIGGNYVEVTLLLPPGVEAHAYEPTPKEIVTMQSSDLLIFTGDGMEPWVSDMLDTLTTEQLQILDVSENVTLLKSDETDEDHHDDDETHETEDEHGAYDPHIWLDPQNAMIMVDNILNTLVALDPEHQSIYEERAMTLIKSLGELDETMLAYFETLDNPTIIYGGHYAFSYFSKRYGLAYMSPYTGFSPDAEPTPQQIARLIDAIDESHIKTIYYEELISPKVAEVVADETGAQMILLHGVHNISKEELEKGESYLSLMYANFERLKKGLGYE